MPTLLLTHSSSLEHDTGAGHPERPDRIRAIEKVLAGEEFSALVREAAPEGKTEDMLRAHPQSHIDAVKREVPQQGYSIIDGDTLLSPGSWNAIIRAAGAGVRAVDAVMSGEVRNAFCALRPPGHHAEHKRAMGFCFINNIAVAAYYAREKYGCERVAVVDFDVHHGNGTQDIFWDEPNMFYGSTHQMPLFPGTGSRSETGAGNIFNAPLPGGCDSGTFRETITEGVLKPLEGFAPDFLFISAGFDAHMRDPLSSTKLVEADFSWITDQLADIASGRSQGRIVSMLEGGYDLQGLSLSLGEHVKSLMKAAT